MKFKLYKKRDSFWVDFYTPTRHRKRKPTHVLVPEKDLKNLNAYEALYAAAYSKAHQKAGEIVAAHIEAGTDAVRIAELGIPTLGKLLDDHFDQHWSKMSYGSTMKYTVRKLKRTVGLTSIAAVTSKGLREWKEKWLTGELGGKPVKKSTINRYLNAISSVLKAAHDDKLITELPKMEFYNEGAFVRERYMLDHEEPRILQWMQRMQKDDTLERRWEWEYMEALFVFLTDTGFRFGEAFKFTLTNTLGVLQLNNPSSSPVLTSPHEADLEHGCTKNTIGRRIPLTARAYKAACVLLSLSHHTELELRSRTRPKVAWDWCTHRFDKCLLDLGINVKGMPARKKLTLHCLRHTCASRLIVHNNIVVVSRWLGHANIKTTMRYLKLDTKAFGAAAASLEERVILQTSGEPKSRVAAIIAALRDLSLAEISRSQIDELQLLVSQLAKNVQNQLTSGPSLLQ